MSEDCTCGKHIGIGAGGAHVGGFTDPNCVVHKGERPPWMKLDDWMKPYEALGIPPGPVLAGSPEYRALQEYRERHG
jgi:hypothetical protein